ncbi:MAG: rod-binding protein [Desulfuromonadaceae bacterium]|jgi:peptidoglycan hydrolase FlgJ
MKLKQLDPSLLLTQSPKTVNAKATDRQDTEALRKNCQEFEAIFVQSMFKAMRSTVPDGGLFPKGMAEDAFRDMLDLEIAKTTASQGTLGIADALFRQLQPKEIPED